MGQSFRGGVPYSVDVRRLCDAFPVPTLTEGREIEHHQLEEIINVKKGASRYYAVINSWINSMKHSNGIFIVWRPTLGVKVLPPSEILAFAELRTRQKIRLTGRAIKIFPWVDRTRLDGLGQQRFDHQVRRTSLLQDALDTCKKEMAIDLAPIRSLPKPKLIRDAS